MANRRRPGEGPALQPSKDKLKPRAAGAATAATLLLWLLFSMLGPVQAVARAQRVVMGAYVPHADQSPGLIDSFAEQVGWQPKIVNSYKNFDQPAVYVPQLEGIRSRGALPMVTWEPQTSSGDGISLAQVAGGAYDGYLMSVARTAAAWGNPIMIRFGQEMNGGWYPWSPPHGNSAHSYVAAWRHIVRVFRREGATNVKWVWTPYVHSRGDFRFQRFYPGDRYVDWPGLDGYNWGGSFPWQSFHKLFASSYKELVQLTSRPLIIGEIGCGEIGGRKAAWLRRMLRYDLPRMGHIRAVVWFDETDSKGDLRVDTSSSALNAFRRWTDQPFYSAGADVLLRTPRRLIK